MVIWALKSFTSQKESRDHISHCTTPTKPIPAFNKFTVKTSPPLPIPLRGHMYRYTKKSTSWLVMWNPDVASSAGLLGKGFSPLKAPSGSASKGRVYKPMKLGTLWKQGRRRQRERSKKIDLMSWTIAKHVCFKTFSFLRRRSRKINYIFSETF